MAVWETTRWVASLVATALMTALIETYFLPVAKRVLSGWTRARAEAALRVVLARAPRAYPSFALVALLLMFALMVGRVANPVPGPGPVYSLTNIATSGATPITGSSGAVDPTSAPESAALVLVPCDVVPGTGASRSAAACWTP